MSGIPAGAGALLGKRLGKFEILALLALGGTAEIYLARIGGAAGFEKYVVVKCLHDHLADDIEFVKMFLDEARLAAHLDHSNVVQTMELGEHENRYYMVMEFLAGLSLAMIVRRSSERLPGGKLPVPLTLNILAQACAGLHYAHEKAMNGKPLNIVHRDISPQNLVISFEGVVKVVDFGIAKAELRETRTRSGTIKGKFAYMSPEQCVANNVDRRTDVFALGVIAHELLTGRRLFKKNSPYETYQAVIECAVDPPSKINVELDPALDAIIMKAIAKDKEQRYPNAEGFGDALLGYLHHRGKGSGPGEVARFFDTSFAQEIDEHGQRMRELISGRDPVASDGVGWGEEDDKQRNQTVDLGGGKTVDLGPAGPAPQRNAGRPRPEGPAGRGGAPGIEEKSETLDTVDIVEVERPSSASLSDVIDDLGPSGDEDDMPADRTRIEANPLEQVQELDRVEVKPKHKTPAPALIPTQIASLDPTNPNQPNRPVMPPSGALPLPAPPTGPLPASPLHPNPRPSSGKFPDLANLPTQIADEEAAELAKTELGGEPLDPARLVDPHARTKMDMEPPSPERLQQSGSPNGGRPTAGPAPNSGQPGPGMRAAPAIPQPQPPQTPSRPQPRPPPQPGGAGFEYPVMDAKLREQMAMGATVFPSETPSAGAVAPAARHDSGRAAQVPDSGPRSAVPDSGPLVSQFPRAADLASPIGQHYGEQVDWAAAAAIPAKAIPPWKLAVLFVGAIVGALLLTLIIAAIFS